MWNSTWFVCAKQERRQAMSKSVGGVRGGSATKSASQKIADAINSLDSNTRASAIPFTIGKVEDRMKRFAKEHGIELASDKLSMSPKQLQHALRDSKSEAGKTVTPQELISFPSRLSSMQLYHDSQKNNFVYTDGKAKYVIHPNYAVKKNGRHVNFITASRITSSQEFSKRNYTKIE